MSVALESSPNAASSIIPLAPELWQFLVTTTHPSSGLSRTLDPCFPHRADGGVVGKWHGREPNCELSKSMARDPSHVEPQGPRTSLVC